MINPDLPRYPSIIHALATAVSESPDNTALVCGDQRITYAEYGRAVAGLANTLLELDVKGGRVVVMMSNSIEMAVAIFAVMAAGAQVAPVNPFFKETELEPILADAEAGVILADPAALDKVNALAADVGAKHVLRLGSGGLGLGDWLGQPDLHLQERHLPEPADPSLLIFSGGTTGLPKGVEHDHQGLAVTMAQHCTAWPVEFGAERFLSVAPLFHIWGLGYAALVPIYARGALVLVPRFEPEALLQAIDTHRITVFAGGPAPIYFSLMGSPRMEATDFSALKYCLTGGAPCPAELHRTWQAATGCRLLEGYGMSETGPICLTPANRPSRLLSVGFPVAETEIQIVDIETGTRQLPANEPGEIRARGPQFTRGYRHRPEETAELIRDGWLYTGDIGYVDEESYLFLIDRKKEMVIVGGYNVYPRQVDEVLMNHPKILEAATVGKPDQRLGEVMVAFVVLKAGEQMKEDEFFAYCRDSMVKYKRPVEVTFLETLPRTGARKIDKRALRKALAG